MKLVADLVAKQTCVLGFGFPALGTLGLHASVMSN